MVHLPALPGSPLSALSIDECVERAQRDAEALQSGGVDGVIIENFNDVPFRRGRVEAHTVATMTRIALRMRKQVDCRLGINVLRNDALSAFGIAAAAGADFIRVNVHSGVMVTDQGIIEGQADETLRLRRSLGAEHIQIFADVLVKHAVPLGPVTLEEAVSDAAGRGLADAIVVTGVGTGRAALAGDVARAAAAARHVPVYVGSGVTDRNVADFTGIAQGVIVGSWLKTDGDVRNPVDVRRVRRLRAAIDAGHDAGDLR